MSVCSTIKRVATKPVYYKHFNQLIKYETGLKIQEQLHSLRKDSIKGIKGNINFDHDVLLLLEHYPTFTEGRRNKVLNEATKSKLNNVGADYYLANRGGQTTFHGPGQLVGYPIFYLKDYKLSTKCYVSLIESVLINVCQELNIVASRNEHTGVWIGDNKVGAIGVLIRQYITSHGFALNVNNSLEWYEYIIPCGIKDRGVTNILNNIKKQINVNDVLPLIIKHFSFALFEEQNKVLNIEEHRPELNEFIMDLIKE